MANGNFAKTERIDPYGWGNNPYSMEDARAVQEQYDRMHLPKMPKRQHKLYKCTGCGRIVMRARTEKVIEITCHVCGTVNAREYSQKERIEDTTYQTALALLRQYEKEQQ